MYEDYFIAHAMNNMITFGLIKIGKFMLRIILRLLGLLCTCAWRKFPSSAGLMRGFSRQHIEKVASGCVVRNPSLSEVGQECGTKDDSMMGSGSNYVKLINCEKQHNYSTVVKLCTGFHAWDANQIFPQLGNLEAKFQPSRSRHCMITLQQNSF